MCFQRLTVASKIPPITYLQSKIDLPTRAKLRNPGAPLAEATRWCGQSVVATDLPRYALG